MCDLSKLEKGYDIPPNFSFDAFEPANVCLKYEANYVRLKKRPTSSFQVFYFQNNQLPDGIFNYIFTGDKTLIAAPLENEFEIASKHKHIAIYGKAKTILASGEMLKRDNTIQFNLSSGTFMKDFMITTLDGKCNNELVAKALELMKRYYPSHAIQFVTRSFITATELPLKREHILKYANAGYEIRLYPTKKSCMAEDGPYVVYQSASRRKTLRRKRRTLKKH